MKDEPRYPAGRVIYPQSTPFRAKLDFLPLGSLRAYESSPLRADPAESAQPAHM
jgi:hypothetical protein